ncbi:MAG: hypothetical protein ACK4S4_08065 [Pyrinomonadaceae bacterium]
MNDKDISYDDESVVSRDELMRRINERLSSDSRELRDARMTGSPSFGNYYATGDAAEPSGDVDIESIGRELGVLRDDESYVGHKDDRSSSSAS